MGMFSEYLTLQMAYVFLLIRGDPAPAAARRNQAVPEAEVSREKDSMTMKIM